MILVIYVFGEQEQSCVAASAEVERAQHIKNRRFTGCPVLIYSVYLIRLPKQKL